MGRESKSFDKLTTLSRVEGPFDRLMALSGVAGPQEYYLYFEDFEPKPLDKIGRQPKFCNGLKCYLSDI